MDDRTLRLARMLLGDRPTPAGSIPRPRLPDFQQPGSMMPPFSMAPSTTSLPPFAQPDDSLPPMDTYMAQANAPVMPPVTVQASPQPPAPSGPPMVAPMPEASRQGNYGPGWDVKNDVQTAVQQMLAANLLPEQWKGAFVNQYGAPR